MRKSPTLVSAAVLAAAHSNGPGGDYLIGEEFDLEKHRGLRRMDDPCSDGSSLSCWSGRAESSTNYSGTRTATLHAASHLHGAGSPRYNTVAVAWSAVAVS